MTRLNSRLILVCTVFVSLPFAAQASGSLDHMGGITISDQSTSKSLSLVGKVREDTSLYTDTAGLQPAVNLQKVKTYNRIAEYTPPEAAAVTPKVVEEVNPIKHVLSPMEEKFALYDGNNNGLISEDEFLVNDLSVYSPQIFKKYDMNNNGVIERSEFERYVDTVE